MSEEEGERRAEGGIEGGREELEEKNHGMQSEVEKEKGNGRVAATIREGSIADAAHISA